VAAYTTSLKGLELVPQPPVEVGEAEASRPHFLDVRSESEYKDGHIPGAQHIHAGQLMARLEAVPRERPVVVYCQSGARSAAAASALRAAGLSNIQDLAGGYDAWPAEPS
jgi:hydroxyacylglutathione hydrolase